MSRSDLEFDDRLLQRIKARLRAHRNGWLPLAANLYHLGRLGAEGRIASRHGYELADPDGRLQRVGYVYLTELCGLRLQSIASSRGWVE